MNETPGPEKFVVQCDDIQAALFDYLTRELGNGRADLIREHLRRCQACQAAAADMQDTLDALHGASDTSALPHRLSDEHRSRLLRAVMHPVVDWIYRHHIRVSIIVALLALAIAFGALRRVRIWREINLEGVPVLIGEGPPDESGRTNP